MTSPQESSTRLYTLLARDAPTGVIFRRGPSKQVLLLKWDLNRDTFEEGQWLKGRIYERRSDLSPNGKYLIYFAGKFKKPVSTWIAISRPPYLTALAFWGVGDTWTTGGLFNSDTEINLGESARQSVAKGFEVPAWLGFNPQLPASSFPEGVHGAERLLRDGWTMIQKGEDWWWKPGSFLTVTADPPTIWAKNHPTLPLILHMILRGHGEQDGPWEIVEHEVIHKHDGSKTALGRSDWADWDQFTGDLLFARDGRLYRQPFSAAGAADPRELIDLRGLRFEAREAPDWAKKW